MTASTRLEQCCFCGTPLEPFARRTARAWYVAALGVLWLLCSLAMPVTAAAAVAYVQSNFNSPLTSVSSITTTYTTAQSAGDLNVVVISWESSTGSVQSVMDTMGNTYAIAVGPTVDTGIASQTIYYAKNIAAAAANANTVTITFVSALPHPDMRIVEYSGIDTSVGLDVGVGAAGTSTTESSGSVTTTFANDLLVGADVVAHSTTGAGTGYTQRLITSHDDTVEDETVTSVGSYSATAPQSPAGWYVMQMAAFKGASSTTPPTAPTALTVTSYSTSVNILGWGASTSSAGIKNYLVQRCSGAGCSSFAQIAAVTSPGYVDSGLTSGTSYSYRVQAQDVSGNLSSYSGTASATPATQAGAVAYGYDRAARLISAQYDAGQTLSYTLDAAGNRTLTSTAQTARPLPPTALTLTSDVAEQVVFSWTASPSAGVTGYQVFRNGCAIGTGTSNCEEAAAPTNTATSFTDSSLSPNTAYSYTVVAYIGVIDSIPSTALPVTTPAIQPPTVPGSFTANSVSYSQINLTWVASTDSGSGQPGLAGYRIYRGTTSSNLTLLTSTTATSYSDTSLPSGTAYYYAVASYDTAARVSAQTSPVAVTTFYQIVDPSGALTATASALYNMVTGCSVQTGYCKYDFYQTYGLRLTSVIAHETDLSLTTCNPSTTVTNLGAGYSVASDCSVQAPASVYNYPILPTTPTGFAATVNSYSQITLNWASGTVDTMGPGLGGFIITRNGVALPELAASAVSYIDAGLTPNTAYAYTIEAVDTKGVDGVPTLPASGTTPAVTPPPTPTNFTATSISSTQTNLSWTEPSYSGGSGIKNYVVMRQIGSSGTPTALPGSPTTSTSISDTAVAPGTAYIYTVSAQDNSGQVSPAASVSPSATPFIDTPVMTQGEWDNDGYNNYLDDGFESGYGGSMAPATTANGYTYEAFFDGSYSIQAGEGYKNTKLEISGFTAEPSADWLISAGPAGSTLLGSAASNVTYDAGTVTWTWTTGPYFTGSGTTKCTIVHK